MYSKNLYILLHVIIVHDYSNGRAFDPMSGIELVELFSVYLRLCQVWIICVLYQVGYGMVGKNVVNLFGVARNELLLSKFKN